MQLNGFADCTMDTRIREYDGAVLIDRLLLREPFNVIPEVRHELSGIHLYNETILHTAQWIPAFTSMTVQCDSISLSSIRKTSQPTQRHARRS